MKKPIGFIKSVMKVAHIDFSALDLYSKKITYSTGYARQWLGYSIREFQSLAAQLFYPIIHPEDMRLAQKKLHQLLHSHDGEIIEMIQRYRRKDGQYIWGYSRLLVTEWNKNGRVQTITVVSEDVTESMNLQEELSIRMAQLDLISHRNAHELRGPVASIMGLVQLMDRDTFIDEQDKKIVDLLNSTVKKLEMVVNGITSASNPTS